MLSNMCNQRFKVIKYALKVCHHDQTEKKGHKGHLIVNKDHEII